MALLLGAGWVGDSCLMMMLRLLPLLGWPVAPSLANVTVCWVGEGW